MPTTPTLSPLPQLPSTSKINSRLVVFAVLGIAIVSAAVLTFITIQKTLKKPGALSRQLTAIQMQTQYDNPFDKNTQYVNPFDKTKNPFHNL